MIRLLFLLIVISAILAEIRYSLDSDNLDGTWIVENKNKSISVAGRVPGGVYSDLHDGGVLPEPLFYRFNDRNYRWVSLDDWTYKRTFDIPLEVFNKDVINLVFHGIDTVGEVFLNGQSLGVVDNMFVRYVYPVKGIVTEKNNSLEVRLRSAVNYVFDVYDALPYPIPPGCERNDLHDQQGECLVAMVRKLQASFSWDWGPAFPSQGLWKSVEIEGLNVAVVRDLTTTTAKVTEGNNTVWQLNVTVYADLATETFDGAVLSILVAGQTRTLKPLSTKLNEIKNGNYSYIAVEEFILDESEVELWWPNGYGKQPLNDITVALIDSEDEETCEKTVRFGFRTLEVVQEPLNPGMDGLTFYFKVNDVPIFAKGSNWIPGHVLPEFGADPASVRHLLLSANEAHMNMLRVWGGGVYESDLFYQAADELGILIWQDMMFGDALYPATDAFLSSVTTEIEQQVRRLQPHPCIAIWGGNNENEALMAWASGFLPNLDLLQADYRKLYVDVIKTIVNRVDPGRPYVASSPSNGVLSESSGYLASDPSSSLYGDVHYYNYGDDGWNSWIFPDTRFASEYGYQGMPSYLAMKSVTIESDQTFGSEFSEWRQHHPNGNNENAQLIKKHLPLPEDDGSLQYYKRFIYYSQISQGMSTKTESERYRRDRSKLTSENLGNTMGALYWQLNDVWQAPSWSSIEFGGRWKLLHYLAKHFFAPVLVSPEITSSGEVNVFIVSDLQEDLPNLTLDVAVFAFDSFKPKTIDSTPQIVARGSSTLVWKSPSVTNLLTAANCTAQTCFLHFALRNDISVLSENVYFPSSFSDVELPSSNIDISTPKLCGDTCAEFTVSADAVAVFVWLESSVDGVFSDNGFTMTTNETNVYFFTRGQPLNITEFEESLTVVDLSYNWSNI